MLLNTIDTSTSPQHLITTWHYHPPETQTAPARARQLDA